MMSVSTSSSSAAQQIRELDYAGKAELQFISAAKREVKVVESDLARFAREVDRANEAEIKLSKRMGDYASVEVNQQDKAALAAIRSQIRYESAGIRRELDGIASDVRSIVKEGQRDMRRNPAGADDRLVADIIDLQNARVNADGTISYALLRRDQVESELELIRSRAGAEGSLGVYSGDPLAVVFYPLGLGEFYDGNTTSGDMTMFFRLEGNRVVAEKIPQARDRWSVARYNEFSQYGGQSSGVLYDARIDCTLDGSGNIIFGELMTDIRTNRGRTGGPVYFSLRNGYLSSDLQTFSAEVWNVEYNQLVGYLTMRRS